VKAPGEAVLVGSAATVSPTSPDRSVAVAVIDAPDR
jgi:hypothetical protein